MKHWAEDYIKEITEAVNKCSPEVPRLFMRFINKGQNIGTPGLPDKIFNEIESLAYDYRNNCGCKKLHEFERGILKPPHEREIFKRKKK